jgi:hypothetical protein
MEDKLNNIYNHLIESEAERKTTNDFLNIVQEIRKLKDKENKLNRLSAWFAYKMFSTRQYKTKKVSPFFVYWFILYELNKIFNSDENYFYDLFDVGVFEINVLNKNEIKNKGVFSKYLKRQVNLIIDGSSNDKEENKPRHKV